MLSCALSKASAASFCGTWGDIMARVLIADDDRTFLETLSQLLEQAGHQVEAALDGQLALARATSTAFDVLIADIVMPNMDGLELIRTLHRQQPDLIMIAVSSTGGESRGQDYLPAAATFGAAATFSKRRIIDLPQTLERLLAERNRGSRRSLIAQAG
jgi:CheY-like chemotaxis protein